MKERDRFPFFLKKELKKELKIAAAMKNTSMQRLIMRALRDAGYKVDKEDL